MIQRLPNHKSGQPRGIVQFRRRLVLLVIAVVLGTGALYLTIEQFHDPGQQGRDAATSAQASDPERQYASSDESDTARRQTRSAAPDQPERDFLSESDTASDTAPGGSEAGDDNPATIKPDKRTSANKDSDKAEAPPELSISGAVLDDRGSLLPGVMVEARAVGPPGQSPGQSGPPGSVLSQMTDDLGRFVFEPLPEGEYQLSVEDTEEFHGTGLRVRAGVVNAELRVQRIRPVRVYGHIIDEHGGALENVRVRSLGGSRAPPSDIDGAYEIIVEPVKAGQAPVLEFQHPDYRSQRQRVEAISDSDSDADAIRLDVEMEPIGEKVAVLGYVSGPKGEPVPDAEVWLSSAQPRNYLRTQSEPGGEFEFERVELGDDYRLGVNPGPDYRKYVSDPFAVGPGITRHDVRLEAAGYGSLSGRLVDPEGRALKRFSVWLRSQDSGGDHASIPVTSDAGGNFEVEHVPAGTLRLESTSQPHLQAGGIELRPGEARHVEAPLDWGERWMFGKVVDANGNPIAGAQVTLQWSLQHYDVSSSSHRRTATDLEGFFTFSNLGARNYNVTVQAPNFETLRRSYAPGNDELVIVLDTRAGGDP